MKINDLNLLEIDVYENDKVVFSGKCEEAPEEIKTRNIKIEGLKEKKLLVKLI